MAQDENRRQKALMKKRIKDKRRKNRSHKTTFNPLGFADYYYKNSLIKRARDFPIFECLINPQWQELGLARILISRRQPNGKFIIGVFLVDIFCRGLKNTFCNADISLEDYESSLKTRIYQDTVPANCHPRLAHRIIYGAIEYARNLGFEPQKDFALSRFVLDEPSKADFSFDVEFGRDGKPFFIAGPDDDVDYIIGKLSKRFGEGNFNFLYPLEL
jgi:hypothetical protein